MQTAGCCRGCGSRIAPTEPAIPTFGGVYHLLCHERVWAELMRKREALRKSTT